MMIPLVKNFLQLRYRAVFRSRNAVLFKVAGTLYLFIIYYFIIERVILFFDGLFGTDTLFFISSFTFLIVFSLVFVYSFIPLYAMLYSSQSDIESYFHFPVSKQQLIGSRMIVLLLNILVFVLALHIPLMWYIHLAYDPNFYFYLFLVAALFVAAVIPAGISLLILIIIMKLIQQRRAASFNKRILNILFILLATDFIVLWWNISNIEIADSLSGLLHYNLMSSGVLLMIIGLISTVIFFRTAIYVAAKLYEYNPHVSKEKEGDCTNIVLTERQVTSSLIRQELTLLYRKPALFLKGLISTVFVPLLCLAVFSFNQQLDGIRSFLENNPELSFVVIVGFTVATIGWNPSAISSFSRDKNEIDFRSALPVSEKKIIAGKVIASWMLFLPAAFIYFVIFKQFLGIPLFLLILWSGLAIIISLNGALTGAVFDLLFPVLSWTNEQQLISGRTAITTFHTVNSTFVVLLCLVGIFINRHFDNSLLFIFILYSFLLATVMIFSLAYLNKNSSSIFQRFS